MESTSEEINLPSEHVAIVGFFADRDDAERAVDVLLEKGFTDDQISLVARGAGKDEETGQFVRGGLMVTVTAKGRENDAERILREHKAEDVTTNHVGASGRVGAET